MKTSNGDRPTTIGISLSGGGHRATAFALGAFLYLSDAKLNRFVTTISSVSGGSILNGYIGILDKPFSQMTADEFEKEAASLARLLAGRPKWWWTSTALIIVAVFGFGSFSLLHHTMPMLIGTGTLVCMICLLASKAGGTLWGYSGTWFYFSFLLWALLGIFEWVRRGHTFLSSLLSNSSETIVDGLWLASLFIMVVVWGAILGFRHLLTDLAFRNTFRGRACKYRDHPICLKDLNTETRHVFCATEMHAGQHTYFTPDMVYSAGFGLGEPGDLRLSTAVAVSANFPGGFPLRTLLASRFRFAVPDEYPFLIHELRAKFPDGPLHKSHMRLPKFMVLSDGGVFDNLGCSWYLQSKERADRLISTLDDQCKNSIVAVLDRQDEKDDLEKLDDASTEASASLPEDPPSDWRSGLFRKYPEAFKQERQRFYEKYTTAYNAIAAMHDTPDLLMVVNAGASVPWKSIGRFAIPLLGEVLGFLTISNAMYNNTSTERIENLRARLGLGKPYGSVIDMSEHPWDRIYDPTKSPYEWNTFERAKPRMQLVEEAMSGLDRDEQWLLTYKSRDVRTTLLPLGIDQTAHLMYHGYIQTRASLYVDAICPLFSDMPIIEDFVNLAKGLIRKNAHAQSDVESSTRHTEKTNTPSPSREPYEVEVATFRIERDFPAAGKTLAQVLLPYYGPTVRTGAQILGFSRDGVTTIIPSTGRRLIRNDIFQKTRLRVGDEVVLLGSREQINFTISLLGGEIGAKLVPTHPDIP